MKIAKHILGLAVVLSLIALAAPSAAWADTFSIAAAERGWVCTACGASNSASNNGASPTNNYFAGNDFNGSQYRDWFQFAIPTLTGGPLVSATLNLDEPSFGHVITPGNPDALSYAVYGLSGQPVVFADVVTSNPFGSVQTTSASSGTAVTITLNAAALAAIGADQGGFIFIGGIDSAENINFPPGTTGDFSGSLSFNMTVLDLQTASATAPEPSSLLLLGTGLLGLMGMTLLRKRLA